MRRSVLMLFVLTFAGTVFVSAQDREEREKSPLAYSIKFSQIDQKERSATIAIEIKNVSDRTVVIDKKAVRYESNILKHGKEQDDGGIGPSTGRTVTGHHSPAVYRGDLLSLPPNESFRSVKTLRLSDANDEFFENGHSYSVSLKYGFFFQEQVDGIDVWAGTVESNALYFELNEDGTINLK